MRNRTTSQTKTLDTDVAAKLVVVADLGRLKAYRLEDRSEYSRPRLTLIDEYETNVTRHLSEDLTDQAGRFRKDPAVPGALSDGEDHNLELERRQRALKRIAERIGGLLERDDVKQCYLVADARINQSILKEMDTTSRKKIQQTIPANLSKLGPEEIVEQLCGNERQYAREQRQTQRQER